MDYEKKYKDALEIAKKINSGEGVAAPPDWTSYEVIFPELKESEDEKIKRIIYSIIDKIGFHIHDIFTEEEFQCFDAWSHAWLEKQKEKQSIWTIEDAKAGDVLVYETDEVEWIFIYREIVPAASEVPHDLLRYYFLLEGNYFNWNGVSAMITDDYKLYLKPATKEQQDTLFAKMKEAGYEWDSEKKELKKIEVKTLNADKVIEWLNDQACLGWIEDVEVDKFVEKFKKDFELC